MMKEAWRNVRGVFLLNGHIGAKAYYIMKKKKPLFPLKNL